MGMQLPIMQNFRSPGQVLELILLLFLLLIFACKYLSCCTFRYHPLLLLITTFLYVLMIIVIFLFKWASINCKLATNINAYFKEINNDNNNNKERLILISGLQFRPVHQSFVRPPPTAFGEIENLGNVSKYFFKIFILRPCQTVRYS